MRGTAGAVQDRTVHGGLPLQLNAFPASMMPCGWDLGGEISAGHEKSPPDGRAFLVCLCFLLGEREITLGLVPLCDCIVPLPCVGSMKRG